MKSTACKLINTLRSTPGEQELDPRLIVLSIFGYTPDKLGKKDPTFKLGKLAAVEDVVVLTDLMSIAGYQATDATNPAMIKQSTPDSVLKQFTANELSGKIAALLMAGDNVCIDQIWDAYVLARYLHRRKAIKVIVIAGVSMIAVAAIVTGLIMFFSDDDDATTELDTNVDIGEPDIIVESDDHEYGDAPVVVSDSIEI